MIQEITHNSKLLAIIISHKFHKSGIHFFTPDDLSQQLAYMNHAEGKIIEPHVHNPVPRQVHYTHLKSHILEAGDVILLATGGHGFEVLQEVEMIEVKQGPYAGDNDKTRFSGISSDQVILGETSG
jgi:hypothetical protein